MIWDIIRDFIVQYITGGTLRNGNYVNALMGSNDINDITGGSILYNVGYADSLGEESIYITASDWLATTLTMVIMIIGVVLLCLLVRWVFKAVVNAFAFRR